MTSNCLKILAVQEERGPRKTTRLRKLITNYSEIGNRKLSEKNDKKDEELVKGRQIDNHIWGKYGKSTLDMHLFLA